MRAERQKSLAVNQQFESGSTGVAEGHREAASSGGFEFNIFNYDTA